MFANLRQIFRILHAVAYYRLAELLIPYARSGILRGLLGILRCFSLRKVQGERAVRIRKSLEALGPVFVKFGQMLSTRPDLLAADIAGELIKLQDEVPPFSGDEAMKIIRTALGEKQFAEIRSIEPEALASASVAQVHLAWLKQGDEVVIKVLRPGIDLVINRDISLLYMICEFLDRYWFSSEHLRLVEVVSEFDKVIHQELDLRREAANASQLRGNFPQSEMIYVPSVYWDFSRENVMVLERVNGIPIRDIQAIVAAGIDRKKIAENGVEIFFTQAFRDGFFHADMHPGNIFISTEGQYRAVDFGIMGSLCDADKRYLAENMLAFFNRDYRAVAMAHLHAGWVPSNTSILDFEAAIRTVCEPIFAQPIGKISYGRFIVQLLQTARQFNMPIQPQLVLLQKTLLNIEGLGRELYPDLDLWVTAKPFLEKWMDEQVGLQAVVGKLKQNLPKLGIAAPEIPVILHEMLRRLRDDELSVNTRSVEVNRLRGDLRLYCKAIFSLTGSVIAFLLALIVIPLNTSALNSILSGSWLPAISLGMAAVFLIMAILALRSLSLRTGKK